MEALAIGAAAVSTVGTLVSGQVQADQVRAEGKAAKQVSNFQAREMEGRAGQERATSQLQAIEEQRRARLARSRAIAVAAASGGGTDDSVQNVLANLSAEGDWNASAAMYEGEESARSLENQAAATRAEGKYASAASRYAARNIKASSYLSAAGNLMQHGASFYSKYWPKDEESGTTMEGTYGLQPLTGGPGRTRYNYG